MRNPTGNVKISTSWRMTAATTYSFHAVMNENTAVMTIAGPARGSTTKRKACQRKHPSISAASSSDTGIVS